MNVYTPADLARNVLTDATIAVLGFGNQGHAHALNLRDSGARVVVGARRGGSGWNAAAREGFEPREMAGAVAAADVVALLVPDEDHAALFRDIVAHALKPGAALVFAHGFSVAFGGVAAPAGHDAILVAPKGQGNFLRSTYVAGHALTSLVAVETDASGTALAKALSYAALVGCLGAGAIETTFREEAVTDMFGEQAVLCGGVPELVRAAFETLVARGYSPEVAYIECLHELKIITDLMIAGGISGMRRKISGTAAWGSYASGPRVVAEDTRRALAAVLDDIESGRFAKDWLNEAAMGKKRLDAHMREEAGHEIERAGRAVRRLLDAGASSTPDSEEQSS
ncbi:MAG: ketol-acid reductoisomerase [Candidatus Krumholzibacteria bacterium]|nr:ketol-acid reductoisomerase [Candidatus Krumholzibacteria bacterium]MDH4337566.1 ketol-acid reductoisomerase [Candidatus Krumholzibacteria bacterium]MDH5269907.1 ketol-acid reductoisomerase [Candidatus Krumholzibacteria bacterium]